MDYVTFENLLYPAEEGVEKLNRYLLNRVGDIDVALPYVTTKCIAVQAGGLVGMWPIRLAKTFERVYTFEPVPQLYRCLVENTKHLPGVITSDRALALRTGSLRISYMHGGRSREGQPDAFKVPAVRIDDLNLPRLDAIFLDTEGSEHDILLGAEVTIRKYDPVVVVETLGEAQTRQLDSWADEHRYEFRKQIHNDRIYSRAVKEPVPA